MQCLSIGDGDGLGGDWGSSDDTLGGNGDGGSGVAVGVGEVAGIDGNWGGSGIAVSVGEVAGIDGNWGGGNHGLETRRSQMTTLTY